MSIVEIVQQQRKKNIQIQVKCNKWNRIFFCFIQEKKSSSSSSSSYEDGFQIFFFIIHHSIIKPVVEFPPIWLRIMYAVVCKFSTTANNNKNFLEKKIKRCLSKGHHYHHHRRGRRRRRRRDCWHKQHPIIMMIIEQQRRNWSSTGFLNNFFVSWKNEHTTHMIFYIWNIVNILPPPLSFSSINKQIGHHQYWHVTTMIVEQK